MSLEAKAAIIGAMYALQRLFSASGQRGTDLANFNSLLGVSTKTLQEYQYAARQVGVSNQEVEGSFKAIQGAMTKTLMGEGAPKGLDWVAKLTGGISPEDIENFAKQPQLLIQRLQEYAQKETNVGLRNETLKSFGIGDNMIAALTRNAFTPEVMSKAPTYSDSEVNALDKANIAWSNLGNKIEMAVGRFNAMHGGQLVKDISMITDKVLGLTEAFIKLADKLKIFQLIGKSFEGWGMIFDSLSGGVDALNDPVKGKALKEGASDLLSDIPGMLSYLLSDLTGDGSAVNTIAPTMPVAPKDNNSTQNVSVQQTLNFQHDGKDATRTSGSVKKAVQDAFRQMSAQSQGS